MFELNWNPAHRPSTKPDFRVQSPIPRVEANVQSCAECLGTALKGPLGNPEPLSSCNGCGMSLHSTCANNAAKTSDAVPLTTLVKKGSKWFCEQCKSTCESCQRNDAGVCVLGCCTCEKNFHLSCLDPVPEKKPKCPWRCRHCLEHHDIVQPNVSQTDGSATTSRKKVSKMREKLVERKKRISMGASRIVASQSIVNSPIPSTSTLPDATVITPSKTNSPQVPVSQVTPVTTQPTIKKASTVRRRVVPKEKRKEIVNTDEFEDTATPAKPGKKINSQNQPTTLLNQKKQTNPVIDIVYSNDNNPNQSSTFKASLNVEQDKAPQQQLGKSDRMSKEKQKFFRHSAFNSERIVKTSPTSAKSQPPINTTKVARNLKNQLETDACSSNVSAKQKHLSDTSSSCSSSDDDDTSSSGSCSSSSSDNDSDTSTSSQSSSSDNENETNDNESNNWSKNVVGSKSDDATQKLFAATTSADVNGTWGFAAEAKKNFDIFQKNTVQPERVFGNFDGIDKESLVKIDKTKVPDSVKDRPTDGKSSGQLKGLFDSLSHVFSTSDYTRSRQGAPPNYKLGVRRKKQINSLDGPPKVVLKETRSTFRDYKEQRLQEQSKTNNKTEFNSFLNVSNNKLNTCSISVSNNTEAKEQFAKKYFTPTNNANTLPLSTPEKNTNDLSSPTSSPSKIPRRIVPLSLPLERRNLRYHSSSEDEVPYLKTRLTPSNLVKNAINSQSQDARQKSSQLKETTDQKLFGAISKKSSMDFASFRDSNTKTSCAPPPYNNNQSMGDFN
ncbi:Histone acetyltransferase KAT6A [Pseudolycoriella hygida]|uniref:Histone acetyltransferase KAT6A n=1 Tax=Pseudolycoriella hygida TaxID=35572 RepID=A0A9Q0NC28_9DIPT|nr:Histone acetyltransferase KAT6A [Pseudolycoriella hygida]